MLVTVMQFRGGVGKTTITACLAFENPDFFVLTNDQYPSIAQIIDNARVSYVADPSEISNTKKGNYIFDLAGQLSPIQARLVDLSDCIVVPAPLKSVQFYTALQTLSAIFEHRSNARVVVVANQAAQDEYEKACDFLEETYPNANMQILPLASSTAFERQADERMYIGAMVKDGRGFTKRYAPIYEQIKAINKAVIGEQYEIR